MGPKKAPKVSKWQPLPEHAGTMQQTTIPGFDDHSMKLEDLSREDLGFLSKFIDQSNSTLEVENTVIERYLIRMDPTALFKMDQILEAAAMAMQKVAQLGPGASTMCFAKSDDLDYAKPGAAKSFSQSIIGTKVPALIMTDKGPRVQAAHKIEIVNREIDELRNALEEFRQHSRHVNYVNRCRHEELSTRLQEILDSRDYFDNKLLVEGIDPLTGKLPGEKLIRYLEMKLQSEDSEIDKIRMKTSSTRNQLKRVEQQLAQKAELGEILHAIDFEQLKIENRDCQERLDEKILHLIEIKKINGRCGTILNFNLKKLQEQVSRLSDLQKSIQLKEKMIQQLKIDEEKVEAEVSAAEKAVVKITGLMDTFTVPSVMDYIEKKAEVQDTKKEIKICERKLKLKDLTLASQAQKLRAKMDPSNLVRAKSSKRIANF